MSIEIKKIGVLSSDGIHTLAGVIYEPEGEIKGIFHIVHGMTEYIGRYKRIMTELTELGYLCVGYDNLGHGYTARDEHELGYIADKRGWELLAKDVAIFADAVKAQYGQRIPYCLMGHSMGSFIVRLASERFIRPDKLIIMGTGGPNPAAGAGLALIAIVKLFKGGHYISRLVDDLAFGNYNKRFADKGETHKSSWLTTDDSVRKKYWEDPFCSFKFSVSAMGDLIRLMKYSNSQRWFKNMPSELPILLLSGQEDPVGSYGKGVLFVEAKLRKNVNNVSCILYKNARHEILNDFTYEEVRSDILNFMN